MPGIFISYRQDDAKAWAITLRDELARVFGDNEVFLDKDTLQAGNWRQQIERALSACKVMLVVIGPRWLTVVDAQDRPRLHLADDVHHQEIALALSRRDLTLIPVLVDDTPMPRPEQLPADLRTLGDQQARKIGDTQQRRQADLAVLIDDIRSIGGIQPRSDGNPRSKATASDGGRFGWLRIDPKALSVAFAMTLVSGIGAYVAGAPMDEPSLFFLLLVFYAAVSGVRWLWSRARKREGEQR